jgi:hypothetical protein
MNSSERSLLFAFFNILRCVVVIYQYDAGTLLDFVSEGEKGFCALYIPPIRSNSTNPFLGNNRSVGNSTEIPGDWMYYYYWTISLCL